MLEASEEVIITSTYLEQLQDFLKNQGEELTEMNLTEERKETRLFLLVLALSIEGKYFLIYWKNTKEALFVWKYPKMPGLNLQLVTHKLNIREASKEDLEELQAKARGVHHAKN